MPNWVVFCYTISLCSWCSMMYQLKGNCKNTMVYGAALTQNHVDILRSLLICYNRAIVVFIYIC